MSLFTKFLTPILLLLFTFTPPSTAEIKSIKIRSDDRPMILFQKFGFTNSGNITVGVSGVSVTSSLPPLDPSGLGFFLLSEQSIIEVLTELQQNPNFCVLDSNFINLLFTFRDLSPPSHSSFRKSYPVFNAGEYSLFFANCNPESSVTMDVRTEMFNSVDGTTKDYLSPGLTLLPSIYFIFSLIYLCFLGFWIYVCFKNKLSVHQVHLLMCLLLCVKLLNLICAAGDKYYVKVTGTPHGWNSLFHIFQFIKSEFSFTVIVLIGAGWPSLKQSLFKREKIVLITVITLQVLANVASVVINETGPFNGYWVSWNQAFLLLDFVCCCAIVLPIVWSMRLWYKTDGKVARNNLVTVGLFFIVVFGYLLFTRIGVFGLKIFVDYKNQWVCSAAEEMGTLVFYLVMFFMFRPVEEEVEYFVFEGEVEGEVEGGEYEEAPEMAKG